MNECTMQFFQTCKKLGFPVLLGVDCSSYNFLKKVFQRISGEDSWVQTGSLVSLHLVASFKISSLSCLFILFRSFLQEEAPESFESSDSGYDQSGPVDDSPKVGPGSLFRSRVCLCSFVIFLDQLWFF